MRVILSPVCERVRSQVSLELDGQLSQLEQAMVSRHLERCAGCCTFRDDLVTFTRALRQAPPECLGRPIALPRLGRARTAAFRGAVIRVGAAAAGIALVLGLGLGNRGLVSSTFRSESTARPAYLDSPDYEARIIQQVRSTRPALRTARAI
jgi:anti-sigma factor RsiW